METKLSGSTDADGSQGALSLHSTRTPITPGCSASGSARCATPATVDVSPDERSTASSKIVALSGHARKAGRLYGCCGPRCWTPTAALQRSNPLSITDAPLLRFTCWKRGTLAWAAPRRALIASDDDRARADAWAEHLRAYLDAAGGIMGDQPTPGSLPEPRATEPFQPDFFPRRDERFTGQWNFVFPPHEVARTPGVPVEEKTLALMCKRTLEMDVPEAMARMIAEAQDMPWAYYVDMCRQLWDEARRDEGISYFGAQGVDWRREIPLTPGFRAAPDQHMNPMRRTPCLTHRAEHDAAKTGKKYEWGGRGGRARPLATLSGL